jgi:hypothetical protein
MMKRLLGYLGILLLSVLLGAGSAVWVCEHTWDEQGIKSGVWTTSLLTGSAEAGMYERASMALSGLFAMTKSEAVYFRADVDSDGNPLRAACDYVIEGVDPDARWWSVTAYGSDHFLIPNPQNRWAYSGGSVAREGDGSYRIYLSASEKQKNWLPTGGQGTISLSLRLYNPGQAVIQDPSSVTLPVIRKVVCP